MMKRPRAGTAARASAAMIAAALRATPSSSGSTSMFTRQTPVRRIPIGGTMGAWQASCAEAPGCFMPSALRFLHVSTEFIAYRRQQLVAEIRLATRAEALVERGRQHRG